MAVQGKRGDVCMEAVLVFISNRRQGRVSESLQKGFPRGMLALPGRGRGGGG